MPRTVVVRASRGDDSIPSPRRRSVGAQWKRRAARGLCAVVVCVIMYRHLATSESPTPEIAFQTVPLYVQIIITLIGGGGGVGGTTTVRLKRSSVDRTSSSHRNENVVETLRWTYWALTATCLVAGNWSTIFSSRAAGSHVLPENVIQILLCFIPLVSEIRYCRMCVEFKYDHRYLNKLVADENITAEKLLAIRTERKTLNDHVGMATASYGAQVLSEIAAAAVATVFRIHRALRSAERSENTVTSASAAAADLSDVLHRALRLFALCKVSGDITREAYDIVTNLLDINPSADNNLEKEVSFFLWEIVNSPSEMRLVYGALALCPKLFVSVFSWCVGFILILLQFRWPRTY